MTKHNVTIGNLTKHNADAQAHADLAAACCIPPPFRPKGIPPQQPRNNPPSARPPLRSPHGPWPFSAAVGRGWVGSARRTTSPTKGPRPRPPTCRLPRRQRQRQRQRQRHLAPPAHAACRATPVLSRSPPTPCRPCRPDDDNAARRARRAIAAALQLDAPPPPARPPRPTPMPHAPRPIAALSPREPVAPRRHRPQHRPDRSYRRIVPRRIHRRVRSTTITRAASTPATPASTTRAAAPPRPAVTAGASLLERVAPTVRPHEVVALPPPPPPPPSSDTTAEAAGSEDETRSDHGGDGGKGRAPLRRALASTADPHPLARASAHDAGTAIRGYPPSDGPRSFAHASATLATCNPPLRPPRCMTPVAIASHTLRLQLRAEQPRVASPMPIGSAITSRAHTSCMHTPAMK